MQHARSVAICLVLLFACVSAFAPNEPFASGSGRTSAAHTSFEPSEPHELHEPQTMRVDYLHSGGPGGETVTLDRVREDGPWPGSNTALLDDSGLGEYFFEVIDAQSGRRLYSRGFASIYGEWETTPEVRLRQRTFHESLRFPWPADPVRVLLKQRDQRNVFTDLWTFDVDPRVVDRSPPSTSGRVVTLTENGPANAKVDVLLISEGYRADELPAFRSAATRLVEALFAFEPFRTRRSDFNIRLLEVAGRPTSVEFNVFGIQRYAVTYDNRALRDLAASAPYDTVVILINEEEYGGGGIFNHQSTVAAGNASAEYVFIHEFGHNLAGLGDEYVGNVTYEPGHRARVEPWEPNLTALLDPRALKWRDLVEPGTPIPTPLTRAGKVGAFEGGGYRARGIYRPEIECVMGSRTAVPFCRVCQRAIHRVIDLHTR